MSQSIKCINVVYLTFEAKWMKQYDGYLLKRGGGGGEEDERGKKSGYEVGEKETEPMRRICIHASTPTHRTDIKNKTKNAVYPCGTHISSSFIVVVVVVIVIVLLIQYIHLRPLRTTRPALDPLTAVGPTKFECTRRT